MANYTLEDQSIYCLITGGLRTHSLMQRCSDSLTEVYSPRDSQTRNHPHLLMLNLLRHVSTKTELSFGAVTHLGLLKRLG